MFIKKLVLKTASSVNSTIRPFTSPVVPPIFLYEILIIINVRINAVKGRSKYFNRSAKIKVPCIFEKAAISGVKRERKHTRISQKKKLNFDADLWKSRPMPVSFAGFEKTTTAKPESLEIIPASMSRPASGIMVE